MGVGEEACHQEVVGEVGTLLRKVAWMEGEERDRRGGQEAAEGRQVQEQSVSAEEKKTFSDESYC